MNRRNFLQALTAIGSVAWITKSMPVFAQSQSSFVNPIPVLTDPSIAGLTEQDLANLFTVSETNLDSLQPLTYPQSVASGDPQPNGIVLWTRIAPEAQGGPYSTCVAWQISTSQDFSNASVLLEGVSPLDPSKDNTVKLPISHVTLAPYSTYYYRFLYNQIPSRTGRFKTLPSPEDNLSTLKLGYVVCQDYGNGYYTALAHLAEEEVDYVVHLGDYIYETIASSTFQSNPVRTVPPFPSGGQTPQDIDDYRHLYKTYRSDQNQQLVHERFAYIQLWDDHEFANDCHQDFHPDNNVSPVTADTPQPALRQAASQAWSEFGLADVPFDPSQDWRQAIRLYRKFQFGSLADLIVTDERLYRDGPPCGNTEFGQRYFTVGCAGLQDPNRTMLGTEQRQWFLDQVTNSQAIWKLWANEVMLMQLKATVVYISLDQWDGYPQERALLLRQIRDTQTKNFVALTGDLHTFLAGYLRTDFNNPFEHPMGIELMVGSISSANFAEEIEAAVHLPSAPVPAKQMGVSPDLLDPVIRILNPHIRYWNSSTHGYGLLTITPKNLTCEFKAVSTIREPIADLIHLKTFTVPANKVHLKES